jgi:hypothetical protein
MWRYRASILMSLATHINPGDAIFVSPISTRARFGPGCQPGRDLARVANPAEIWPRLPTRPGFGPGWQLGRDLALVANPAEIWPRLPTRPRFGPGWPTRASFGPTCLSGRDMGPVIAWGIYMCLGWLGLVGSHHFPSCLSDYMYPVHDKPFSVSLSKRVKTSFSSIVGIHLSTSVKPYLLSKPPVLGAYAVCGKLCDDDPAI